LTFPSLCPLPLTKGGACFASAGVLGRGMLIYQLLASEIFC